MKRTPVIAAAILAGAISIEQKKETVDCKETPCTMERAVTIPEQPHASEERPEAVVEIQYVETVSSL
jgi:hypothetical protein